MPTSRMRTRSAVPPTKKAWKFILGPLHQPVAVRDEPTTLRPAVLVARGFLRHVFPSYPTPPQVCERPVLRCRASMHHAYFSIRSPLPWMHWLVPVLQRGLAPAEKYEDHET